MGEREKESMRASKSNEKTNRCIIDWIGFPLK